MQLEHFLNSRTEVNKLCLSSFIHLSQAKTAKAFIVYVKLLSEPVRLVDPYFKQGCNCGQRSKKKGRKNIKKKYSKRY